ncbi:SMP-30/gluconolactonase/LRE family protein [Salinibacterium soli]|uniref:SMP-30/gluconolactonase/LRE family protein n=1 Tax=Antiquaquibacter soli TaxID=3064523 RepID=A0ABT9BJK9_9MICO|nr:SMP-30/gluconolactonase/LRE family protein [Protaetiibacter sp. WY-16]MDO7880734.1 SMP-30/gluconolactonase/LRE family protein [Protaetiibacter sp. WY-16]
MIPEGAAPERLWTGGEWLEGPAWLAADGVVRFSDIPNDRILQFDEATGDVVEYATAVEFTNGRTVDADGSVIQCSHGLRRVERDAAGVVTPIVAEWAGGRFNSPNDVVVARDGAVYFSDPPYGLHESGREGHPGTQDYDGCFVFRVIDGVAEPVITDMVHPNGLAFSPDESLLYVADTAEVWNAGPRHIRVYDTATWEGRLFVQPTGFADGLRVDPLGNVWTSSSAAIEIYAPDARLLQRVEFPETVSNLCFGDGVLYVTATTSLYRLPLG